MATVNDLSATARPKAGKGAARAVRREGRVPAVIYGDGKEPIGISLDFKELKQKIYAGHFLTTVCNLEVDGTKHRVIPRDFQLDPVMDNPIHVDFLRLGEGAMVRVRVPIRAKNADQAPGIKRGGSRRSTGRADRCAGCRTCRCRTCCGDPCSGAGEKVSRAFPVSARAGTGSPTDGPIHAAVRRTR